MVKKFINFFDKEATSLHIAVVNLKFKKKKSSLGIFNKVKNKLIIKIIHKYSIPLKRMAHKLEDAL